jgi:hypothetical protein
MTEPARQDAVGTLIDFPVVLRIVMQQFIGSFRILIRNLRKESALPIMHDWFDNGLPFEMI